MGKVNTPVYNKDSIVTKEKLDHLRHRLGMYVGDTSSVAVHVHALKELLDNVTDEAKVRPDINVVSDVVFIKKGESYQIVVIDRGRGIPLEKLEASYTIPGTSGKWDDSYFESVGTNGMGTKCVVAMSTRFYANTTVGKKSQALTTYVKNNKIQVQYCKKISTARAGGENGVTVFMEPDTSVIRGHQDMMTKGIERIIELVNFTAPVVPNLKYRIWVSNRPIADNSFRNPTIANDVIFKTLKGAELIHQTEHGTTVDEYLENKFKVSKPFNWEVELKHRDSDMSKDRAMSYTIRLVLPEKSANIIPHVAGAINMIPINNTNSDHIRSVLNVLKEKLIGYIDSPDMKSYFKEIYKLPMYGFIIAGYHGAEFVNQTKTDFRDEDFRSRYSSLLRAAFKKYDEMTWLRLYESIIDHLSNQFNRYSAGGSTSGNIKNVEGELNRPSKFKGCTRTDPKYIQLYLTEGDSAGSAASNARDPYTQAVYSLRGKITNAIRCKQNKLLKDEIYQDLRSLIGIGPGDTNLDKCNWNQIVILADADADGRHIAVLCLCILYRINPLLLSEGKVFVSNPPLYRMRLGSNKKSASVFLRDDVALLDAFIHGVLEPNVSITIKSPTGRKRRTLRDSSYRDAVYKIQEVSEVVYQEAYKLCITPHYLEHFLDCIDAIKPDDVDCDLMAERLGVEVVTYSKDLHNVTITKGHVDLVISMAGVYQSLHKHILPAYESAYFRDIQYFVETSLTGGKPTELTILQLRMLFDDIKMKHLNITRYKGVGETNEDELRLTCFDTNTRSMYRVVDIGDVEEIYSIMGSCAKDRKRLIR